MPVKKTSFQSKPSTPMSAIVVPTPIHAAILNVGDMLLPFSGPQSPRTRTMKRLERLLETVVLKFDTSADVLRTAHETALPLARTHSTSDLTKPREAPCRRHSTSSLHWELWSEGCEFFADRSHWLHARSHRRRTI